MGMRGYGSVIENMEGVGEEIGYEFIELERILNLRGVGEEFEYEFLGG